MMVVYEIHTFRDGIWKIDSVFDDRDLAVVEAQRIERGHRYSAVRVVEESFDQVTERSNTRTVYRGTKIDRVNQESADRRKQPSTIPPPPRPVKPVKSKRSLTRVLILASLTLGIIVLAGMAAMYALQTAIR